LKRALEESEGTKTADSILANPISNLVKASFFEWYNCDRPHGAFDLSKLETLVQMFHEKMEDRESIIDPEVLTRGEMTPMMSVYV